MHVHDSSTAAPPAMRCQELVLPLLAADSWDYHAGRVNLATGQISRLPMDYVTDVHFITYGSDGAALAMGSLNESTLWRFEPRTPATIPR